MSGEIVLYILLTIVVSIYARRIWLARVIPSYALTEVHSRLKNASDIVLLDVRTNSERRHHHIKGSLHIPLHELVRRSDELRKFQGKEIVYYCQSGNRSITAAARLRKLGFRVANMKGGIGEWNYQQLSN